MAASESRTALSGPQRDSPADDRSIGNTFRGVFIDELEAVRARRARLLESAPPAFDPGDPTDAPAAADGFDAPLLAMDDDGSEAGLTQVFRSLEGDETAWRQAAADGHAAAGLIGVALSGGGVRSSTFNLGVLQGIHRAGLFPFVDYLSTVSGGGYVGTFLTTSIVQSAQSTALPTDPFPFRHRMGEVENDGFRRLRNHASFLTPGGRGALLQSLRIPVVLLRGLAINAVQILPLAATLAALVSLLTVRESGSGPYRSVLSGGWLHEPGAAAGSADVLSALGPFPMSALAAILLVSILLLVPPILFSLDEALLRFRGGSSTSSRRRAFRGFVDATGGYFLIGLLIVFWLELQPTLMNGLQDLLAALAVGSGGATVVAALLADRLLTTESERGRSLGAAGYACLVTVALWFGVLWLAMFVEGLDGWALDPALALLLGGPLAYRVVAFFVDDINATSLHRFYRDRLVEAFVAQVSVHARSDAREGRNTPRLHELLRGGLAPYPLINAAVNVEHPHEKYRSGRQASFFLFSPLYTGGIRTGFVPTSALEAAVPDLDVGTAMAVSGAAVAPNMGRYTNRFVAFVLAILNVRLGYWILNPRRLEGGATLSSKPSGALLFREMFGSLPADAKFVNLSDGGHIENLGIYELMRRQCRLIVCGDGECDPSFGFEGLSEAIRLARIDFGFRIDMDGLDAIRNGTRQYAVGTIHYAPGRTGKLIYLKSSLGGDHTLASTLAPDFHRSSRYRDDDQLYDENSYVAHYKSVHPEFPNESTADQFFDEAQFEAYRALGYQVARAALSD